MLACHAGGPGSIPGRCKLFSPFAKKIILLSIFRQIILPSDWRRVPRREARDERVLPPPGPDGGGGVGQEEGRKAGVGAWKSK